jgi:hypothetical protein
MLSMKLLVVYFKMLAVYYDIINQKVVLLKQIGASKLYIPLSPFRTSVEWHLI